MSDKCSYSGWDPTKICLTILGGALGVAAAAAVAVVTVQATKWIHQQYDARARGPRLQ